MQNREKIIKEVAKKLGLSPKVVREVVYSQCKVARDTMATGGTKSVYIRKLGTFMHKDTRYTLNAERIKKSNERKQQSIDNQDLEDPLEF